MHMRGFIWLSQMTPLSPLKHKQKQTKHFWLWWMCVKFWGHSIMRCSNTMCGHNAKYFLTPQRCWGLGLKWRNLSPMFTWCDVFPSKMAVFSLTEIIYMMMIKNYHPLWYQRKKRQYRVSERKDRGSRTHIQSQRNRYLRVLSFSGFMSEWGSISGPSLSLPLLVLFLSTSLKDTLCHLHFAVL